MTAPLASASGQRWGEAEAQALHHLAQHSAASTRAVVARSLVVRTLCLHLLDLRARLAELEAAIAAVVAEDEEAGRLQEIPGWSAERCHSPCRVGRCLTRSSASSRSLLLPGWNRAPRRAGALQARSGASSRGQGLCVMPWTRATLVAVRFRVEWRVRYQLLLERGRAKKEALTILFRSRLKVISHLLRTRASYAPARVFPEQMP